MYKPAIHRSCNIFSVRAKVFSWHQTSARFLFGAGVLLVALLAINSPSIAFADVCVNGKNNAGNDCTCGDANFPNTVPVNIGNSGPQANSTVCLPCTGGSTYDPQSRTCSCPPGSHSDGINRCGCDAGFVQRPGAGACSACPANAPWDQATGTCSCTNKNLFFNDQTMSCSCPNGHVLNQQTLTCECPAAGMYEDHNKSCQCQGNHVLTINNGRLSCDCPSDARIDQGNGWCSSQCPEGQKMICDDSERQCICSDVNSQSLAPGLLRPGNYACPQRQALVDGRCVYDVHWYNPNNGCRAGWRKRNGFCTPPPLNMPAPPAASGCQPGQTLIRGHCYSAPTTTCSLGQIMIRGRCYNSSPRVCPPGVVQRYGSCSPFTTHKYFGWHQNHSRYRRWHPHRNWGRMRQIWPRGRSTPRWHR